MPAPVANFSGTPTSGLKSLAVSFTDASTNTPTSWSWAFGDSATSTAENPSHTYSTGGAYTVALTATNAGGSNTNTKTGYVTVYDTVTVVPTACTPLWGASISSGTLANVATSDDTYLVLLCSSGGGDASWWDWSTGYIPSQLSKLHVDVELHASSSNCSGFSMAVMEATGDWVYQAIPAGSLPTTDTSKSWETTDVATYLASDGTFHTKLCACGTSPFSIYVDTYTMTLTGQ